MSTHECNRETTHRYPSRTQRTTASAQTAPATGCGIGDPQFAERLRRNTGAEVLFDAFSRGRYSTDASHYQIEPIGVLVPRSWDDVAAALQIAAEFEAPVIPRGAGTSQCGQTVGRGLVIDVSKHLNRCIGVDEAGRRAVVEPGLVLDALNAELATRALWFPVDVSTASRATIGGMTGNNSCGTRSIRYGTMRDNVVSIDAILADGRRARFGPPADTTVPRSLTRALGELGAREAEEIRRRFPNLMRRVGGYNIDALIVDRRGHAPNLAHLLVGSEGTLAFTERVHLELHPIPAHRVLGVCHFPRFYDAMDAAQHLVKLDPSAVELVDRTMIDLARDIPLYRSTVERFVRGNPGALLLVEFAGDEHAKQIKQLAALRETMASLGFTDAVVEAIEPEFQKAIWEVRKSGLNIMMSMKGDGKPISFIEDCAVRLEDLAEYTDRLTQVFERHGTTGTWYAHASVGCLHVRPVLNLKLESEARKMRAIAEEAFEMVREYKGSHSGEHGDGLVRSEFHESMFGRRMVEDFARVKHLFDPRDLLNPGKIVHPPRMDDRSLFRFKPDYRTTPIDAALDWTDWGGLAGAVEMCNNNGACRKFDVNVMCPSYRVTRDEQHLTRGRANALRLALSGQLGSDAFTSKEMYESLRLCVGCKACKRECPTGVDMARMKIEFLHHYHRRHGLPLHDRLTAYLPRYAPWAARAAKLLNARNRFNRLRRAGDRWLKLSKDRVLPEWRKPFSPVAPGAVDGGREVVLFGDTFNTYFEPDNLTAAVEVLTHLGVRVRFAEAGGRPLCCGRTFLSAGLVDQARREAQRTLDALIPYVRAGVPIVGLEPSCLLTFRDEFLSLVGNGAGHELADATQLLSEYLSAQPLAEALARAARVAPHTQVLVHGHCHQKAFGVMPAVTDTLRATGATVNVIASSCCGMAGAFGYHPDTEPISRLMAERDLLPAVRGADRHTLIVADGTSCRHQIADGSGRTAVHSVQILRSAVTDRVS